MAELMSDIDVEKALNGLDGWSLQDAYAESSISSSSATDVYKRVHKEFNFNSFEAAVTFVQHVASIASEMGHHPDILIYNGGSVRITSTTHDLGGITEKDIALVESLEILVNT